MKNKEQNGPWEVSALTPSTMDPKYEKAKRIVCKFDYETVDQD